MFDFFCSITPLLIWSIYMIILIRLISLVFELYNDNLNLNNRK